MRSFAALAMLVLLAACGAAADIPAVDLQLSIAIDRDTVEPGEGVPVRVTRIWNKQYEPEPWSDALLAPLALVVDQVERVEDAERVMETRRGRAYAFSRRDVVVPAPTLRATPVGGGEPRIAKADAIRLRVTPLLDDADPGEPELPGRPLAERVSYTPLWIGLGLLLAALAVGFVRTRRSALDAEPDAAPAAVTPTTSPEAAALAALAALREAPMDTREARDAVAVGVSRAVRVYLADRFGLRTRERTTPEILTQARRRRSLAGQPVAALDEVLTACDLTKFAAHDSDASDLEALIATGERFVHVSSGDAA